MTEYTPERVAELAERLRQIAESQRMDFDSPHVGMTLDESAAALTAVSAERDKAIATGERILADALKVSAERDRLHKAITEALAERMNMEADRILRAALEQKENDDE